MKTRIVKASEIAEHPTHRMDAEYWVHQPEGQPYWDENGQFVDPTGFPCELDSL